MQYLLSLLPFLATAAFASPIVKRADNQLIQSATSGRCLSPPSGANGVANGQVGNETPVVTIDCADAASWNISPGSGSVVLTSTNYALDAGENPGQQGAVKLYTSYPGVQQQTWYLTDDNRIAITDGYQCLTETESGPNYTPCGVDGNQEWRIWQKASEPAPSPSPPISQSGSVTFGTNGPPTSTTGPVARSNVIRAPEPESILPNVPRGTHFIDPPQGNGHRLHPLGRGDLCISVQDGNAVQGASVDISYCFDNENSNTELQLWDFPSAEERGNVRLHSNPGLCIDAGDNAANGSRLKLWSCGEGWPQQSFTHSGINLWSLDNNQCLNVRKESTPGNQQPFNSVADMQTWQCDPNGNGDPYQIFFQAAYPL